MIIAIISRDHVCESDPLFRLLLPHHEDRLLQLGCPELLHHLVDQLPRRHGLGAVEVALQPQPLPLRVLPQQLAPVEQVGQGHQLGLLGYADRAQPDALPEIPLDLGEQEGDILVLGQVEQGLEVLNLDLVGPLEVVVDAFLSVLLVLPDQLDAEVAPLTLLEVLELLGGEEAGRLHLLLQLLRDPLLEDQAA